MPSPYTTFFHATGEPFDIQCGAPQGIDHFYIKGADVWHAESELALIILQEIYFRGFLFRYLFIRWKKAGSIACQHSNEDDALITRFARHKQTSEKITGAGEYAFEKEKFYSIAGKNYSTVLTVGDPCSQHYIDTAWQASRIYTKFPELEKAWQNIQCGMPYRILVPPLKPVQEMERLLAQLLQQDYNLAGSKADFRKLMRAYLKVVAEESFMHHQIRKNLDHHYEKMTEIKEHIEANLQQEFTLEELGKKFHVGPHTIQRKFHLLAGLTPNGYRRYLLTSAACRKKIETDCTYAELLEEACYANVPAIIDGMITHLGGVPEDIAKQKWNIDMPLVKETGILHTLNELLKW